MRVAPRELDGGGRWRKAGRSALTAQEDQGEERGNEQEAAAQPGNQDDGNDSGDGSDDSKS